MKYVITAILLLSMAFCLCACGGNDVTEPATTDPQPEANTTEPVSEAPTVPEGMAVYTVKVTDEGGNPIAGALVQICKDDCFPGATGDDGVASFTRPETKGYMVSFLSLPAGFEYSAEETEFYYEGDAKDITIVLKAVA